MAEDRTYRYSNISKNLIDFEVRSEETDLWIQADLDLTKKAMDFVLTCRKQIRDQIQQNPFFLSVLVPIQPVYPISPIITEMITAANIAQTGPMAAVAGAIAQYVGNGLKPFTQNIIVENGGDIYLATQEAITIGIWAGTSPLSGKIGVEIPPGNGLGVCTSSGTVGHSYSRGKADAVCVISENAAIADAVATQLGNFIHTPNDIRSAIEMGKKMDHILGILIIVKDQMAVWGNIKMVSL